MQKEHSLSFIIIEDDEMDARLLELALRKHFVTVNILWVETETALQEALATSSWDVVLSDYSLPQFTGLDALFIAHQVSPEIPFIFVSGTMGEALAVEAIKAGAADYIVKGQLERLLPAITRELAEVERKKERKKIDAELAEKKELAYKIFYEAVTAMAFMDEQGILFSANDKFRQLLALEPMHNTPIRFTDYMEVEEATRFDAVVKMHRQSGRAATEQFQVINNNEKMMLLQLQIIPIQSSNKQYCILQAVTPESAQKQQIMHIQTHDQLTGLPNHTIFIEGLDKAISLCRLQDKKIVVAVLSVDRFHFYREAFGTRAANTLLSLIATRLKQGLAISGALVAKGEEETFYVMRMVNQWKDDYVETFIKRINTIFSEKILCEEDYIEVTLSCGVSICPLHGDIAQNLLNAAVLAVDDAQARGLSQYSVFDVRMQDQIDRQRVLQQTIQQGLEEDEFFNYYQPKFHASNGKIMGVEALMRWRHKDMLISPLEFIAFSEQIGLIIPLGYQAFNKALEDYNVFEKILKDYSGLKNELNYLPSDFKIAVNVSVKQFSDPNLISTFTENLKQKDIPPRTIELEITESVLLEDPVRHMQRIRELKAEGFSIAIDDFGTGFSSLRYLKDLPADTVKIDKSFIDDVPTDDRSCAIVNSIIVMAHNLGMKVVAEGVETEAQLAYLRQQGCDIIQGYLWSKPLSVQELQRVLRR